MTTQTEALKLALERYMAAYGQALEAHGIELQQQQIEADKCAREALAQPEQEPVVWMYQNKSTHEVRFQKHMRSFVDHGAWYEVPLYSEPLANQEKTSGSPIKQALAQPEQEPVGDLVLLDRDVIKQAIEALDSNRPTEWSADAWLHSQATVALNVALNKPTATTPPQRKPQFKEFIKWAGAQGYDCAQTCNSDTGEWIVLNPMTADLWKAWQAAHIIKGEA